MKKLLILVFSLLLAVALASGAALAKPDNGNGAVNNPGKGRKPVNAPASKAGGQAGDRDNGGDKGSADKGKGKSGSGHNAGSKGDGGNKVAGENKSGGSNGSNAGNKETGSFDKNESGGKPGKNNTGDKPGGKVQGGGDRGENALRAGEGDDEPGSGGEGEFVTPDGYYVEIKNGKIKIKGNGASFEVKNGKIKFKSENGKVEVSGAKTKITGAGLDEFRQKARIYEEITGRGVQIDAGFSDTKNHWAGPAISKLSSIDLFRGYEDGTFRPDDPVTAAEAVALIMRLAAENETEAEGEEAGSAETGAEGDSESRQEVEEGEAGEVPAWAEEAVEEAARRGILNLNRFHSHVQVTRAEVAVLVAKAMGLEPADTADMPFKDGILLSPEDAGYIMALYREGIIQGLPGGKFNPNSAITRAELAVMLERLVGGGDNVSGDDDSEDLVGDEETSGDEEAPGDDGNAGEEEADGDDETAAEDGDLGEEENAGTGDDAGEDEAAVKDGTGREEAGDAEDAVAGEEDEAGEDDVAGDDEATLEDEAGGAEDEAA